MTDLKPVLKNRYFCEGQKKIVWTLLTNIHNEIPQDNKLLRGKFYTILDSFLYKAPENMNETLDEVFDFLEKNICSIKKKTQWVDNIRVLWADANQKFKLI